MCQVMEEVGARPYVVVYFNADADLPAIPDTSFMQELHTALDARHRDRLKVILFHSPHSIFHPPAREMWLSIRLYAHQWTSRRRNHNPKKP